MKGGHLTANEPMRVKGTNSETRKKGLEQRGGGEARGGKVLSSYKQASEGPC